MALPNWLVPTGTVRFVGTEKKLRTAIGALAGKITDDSHFSCILGDGPASFRFKMPCRFDCAFAPEGEGYAVSYRVTPKFSALALFAVLVVVILAALVMANWELAGMIACLMGLLAFLFDLQRSACMEEFTKHFAN